MKRILLFFMLYSAPSIAQQCKSIECYEAYFRNYLKDYTITFKGLPYRSEGIRAVSDTMLDYFLTYQFPNENERRFNPYYSTNKAFRDIIDELDRAQVTNLAFGYILEGIHARITKLPLIERMLATSRFNALIADFNIDVKSMKLNLQNEGIEDSIRKLSTLKQAEILALLSNNSKDIFIENRGLQFLYLALHILDSIGNKNHQLGYIEEQMATLYGSNTMHPYAERQIYHLTQASYYYSVAKEWSMSNYTELAATSLKLYLDDRNDLFDIIQKRPYMDKSKTLEEIDSIIQRDKFDKLRIDALTSIWNAMSTEPRPYSNVFLHRLVSTLAVYFSRVGDIETATGYYNLSLSTATSVKFNSDLIIDALVAISQWYAFIGDENNSFKFSRYAMRFAERKNEKRRIAELQIIQGLNYKSFGIYAPALEWIRSGIATLRQDNSARSDQFIKMGYEGISESYNSVQSLELSKTYYDSGRAIVISQLEHFEKMLRTETDISAAHFENKTNRLSSQMSATMRKLNIANGTLLKRETEIESFSQRQEGLIIQNSRLGATRDSLKREIKISDSILIQRNIALEKSEKAFETARVKAAKSDRAAQRNSNIGFVLLVVLLIVIALAVIGFKRHRNRIRIKDQKIKNIRTELEYMAKAKNHNIRGNFSAVSYLLEENLKDKANLYAKKCTKMFSEILEKWEIHNRTYTLKDEFEILSLFKECEEIRYDRNVEIVSPMFEQFAHVKFIPDILTTLFHNSIKHGFRVKAENCKFTISISKVDDLLCLIVSDNGVGGGRGSYFKNPERGLSILRRRVYNLFEDKPAGRHIKDKMTFDTSPNGTTFKMYFPYE